MLYRGLNVNFNLSDIDNQVESLKNIGLDLRDFDVFRGIQSEGVTSDELKQISNLISDRKKESEIVFSSSGTTFSIMQNEVDIRQSMPINLELDGEFISRTLKYNFIDYDSPTLEIRQTEASGNRPSAWSSFDLVLSNTSPIFYGGELEVIGSEIVFSELEISSEPQEVLFPELEVPTHTLTIKINGVDKEIYLMRGIPLKLDTFFKDAELSHRVSSFNGTTPVWRITNKENGQVYVNDSLGISGTYSFFDADTRERTIEFYYNPSSIRELRIPNLNIRDYPNNVLENLEVLDFERNDFVELPDLNTLTPSLQELYISGNNMSRARDNSGSVITANTQLQNLPNTIEVLFANAVFSDSADIDISFLTSLRDFRFNGIISEGRNLKMLATGSTPKVNSSTIETYIIENQDYTQLDDSITTSTSLKTLILRGCDIETDSSNNDITIASTDIGEFRTNGNFHNIIDFSGKTSIQTIDYNNNIRPGVSLSDSAITGKFAGCSNLEFVRIQNTAADGDIGSNFSNLPKLKTLILFGNYLTGGLTNSSFSGSPNLETINIASGRIDTDNFFGNSANTGVNDGEVFMNLPNLRQIFLAGSPGARGELPDLSSNESLYRIIIRDSGISGPLPQLPAAFSGILNAYLFTDCSFTGSIPAFSSNSIRFFDVSRNQLSGVMPPFDANNILIIRASDNQGLAGTIPSFAFCPRVEILHLDGCGFSNIESESLSQCTNLRDLKLNDTNLTEIAGIRLVEDLFNNYQTNPRAGVTINLLGIPNLSESVFLQSSVSAKYSFLKNTANWSILI